MISRREFLAFAAASVAMVQPARYRGQHVNGPTLIGRIGAINRYGSGTPEAPGEGGNRVAYSDADVAGRAYFMQLMSIAEITAQIDPAGNIFGRRPGADASLPPILFGSHIDTIPNGGKFDGAVGSLAALGVLEACTSYGIQTRHPLEMVVWAHTQPVAFGIGLAGSRAVAGDISRDDLKQVWNGVSRADAIRRIGGDPQRILEARRAKGSIFCYVELHIEQGPTLERQGIPIGVVEGLAGIDRYDVLITGAPNQTVTTPMAERRDPLVAAADLILAVREAVMREPGALAGAVQRIEIAPSSPNLVPGTARLGIDLRDPSAERLATLASAIREQSRLIASATGTTIDMVESSRQPPVRTWTAIQAATERAAASFELKTMRLSSTLPHDAQVIAELAPVGMIFIPSVGGVTDSPDELTTWPDCQNGADVLLRTILELDRM